MKLSRQDVIGERTFQLILAPAVKRQPTGEYGNPSAEYVQFEYLKAYILKVSEQMIEHMFTV